MNEGILLAVEFFKAAGLAVFFMGSVYFFVGFFNND